MLAVGHGVCSRFAGVVSDFILARGVHGPGKTPQTCVDTVVRIEVGGVCLCGRGMFAKDKRNFSFYSRKLRFYSFFFFSKA